MGVDADNKGSNGLSQETWRKVIGAIEESIPLYDEVNNLISFGRAQVTRRIAIQRLQLTDGVSILDGGIGPGTTSKLIVESV